MYLYKGDIVLVPFPFTDFSGKKIRPAVIIWTNQIDVTLCFISSQNLTKINVEEFIIEEADPEFSQTGLKISSKFIVSKIITVQRSLITRRLGKLGLNSTAKLNSCLRKSFQL